MYDTGVMAALAGMRRVLKSGGKLVFLEHGAAPDPGVRKWQDRLNGTWSRLGGGCNLNREPGDMIRQAGFSIDSLEAHYAARRAKTLRLCEPRHRQRIGLNAANSLHPSNA